MLLDARQHFAGSRQSVTLNPICSAECMPLTRRVSVCTVGTLIARLLQRQKARLKR